MSKYSKRYHIALIFPLAFLMLSFANTRTSQNISPDIKFNVKSIKVDVFSGHPATVANATNSVAKLHFFVGRREAFINLPPPTKLIFSHTFDALGPARLSAWVLNENDNFEDSINLESVGPSSIDNVPGLVFGNVVLKPGQLAKIQKALRRDDSARFVIFTPVKVDEHFIGYKIGVSNQKSAGADFAEVAEANPSPPRVY